MGITMGLEVVENGIEGCLNFQDSPGQLAPPPPAPNGMDLQTIERDIGPC